MTAMWGDCPRADIIDAWGEALGQIDPEQVRMALGGVMQAHPDWPPTLGEFLALCRPPPVFPAHRPYLPAPKTSIPAEVAELLAKFGKPKADPKRWAREILAGAEAGTYRLPIGIEFARLALDIDRGEEVDIESKGRPMDASVYTFMEIGGKNQKVRLE